MYVVEFGNSAEGHQEIRLLSWLYDDFCSLAESVDLVGKKLMIDLSNVPDRE